MDPFRCPQVVPTAHPGAAEGQRIYHGYLWVLPGQDGPVVMVFILMVFSFIFLFFGGSPRSFCWGGANRLFGRISFLAGLEKLRILYFAQGVV